MQPSISIKNAPRTIEELSNLTRNQLTLLASSLSLLNDPAVEAAFVSDTTALQAQMVFASLTNYDATNGGPQTATQPQQGTQPMTQQPPPQAMPTPVAPGQAPPQVPQATPPQAAPPQAMPPAPQQVPQAMPGQPPLAPPPQVQAPQGVPQAPMGAPPMPPQAPVTQQVPPQAPGQAPMPPQPPPQAAATQAPPMPPQTPPMPPQATAPQVPPQAAPRQPQTTADPGNSGGGQIPQLVTILGELQKGMATIGAGVDAGNADLRSAVALQALTLRTLIALAGVWQVDPSKLAQLVQSVPEETLQGFVNSAGGPAGKA